MHGYHVFDDHRVNGSLNIAAGDGAYIYDTAGNRYLDAVGGMWCTNIGLGREEMARTVAEQTRLLAYSNPFCDMANPRHRTLPQARRAGPRRPRPRVPHHRRFHRRGHRDPPHALLPELPRQARQERHHADQRLPRLDLPRHVAGRQERRPAGRVRLDERIHHLACPYYYRAPEGVGEAEFLDGLVEEFERKILELGADRVGRSSPSRCSAPAA